MLKTYIIDNKKILIDFSDYFKEIEKATVNFYEKGIYENLKKDNVGIKSFWDLANDIAYNKLTESFPKLNTASIDFLCSFGNLTQQIYNDLLRLNSKIRFITVPQENDIIDYFAKRVGLDLLVDEEGNEFYTDGKKVFKKYEFLNDKCQKVYCYSVLLNKHKTPKNIVLASKNVFSDKENELFKRKRLNWSYIKNMQNFLNKINSINSKYFLTVKDLKKYNVKYITSSDLKWHLDFYDKDKLTKISFSYYESDLNSYDYFTKNKFKLDKMDLPYKLWSKVNKYFEPFCKSNLISEYNTYYNMMEPVVKEKYFKKVKKIFKKFNKEQKCLN
jgi:hypothetical protein